MTQLQKNEKKKVEKKTLHKRVFFTKSQNNGNRNNCILVIIGT
jgi:hypothetical protein